MTDLDPAPLKKARAINVNGDFYGTFAEIGAGQEVARFFFLAGRASQTIAKSMSAYDMTVSDSIYGKSSRYVCEDRLSKMLDHEITLLRERLDSQRGSTTRFFAFADTVATSSHADSTARCHGWMGVRFQIKPRGPFNDIVLHVRMRDRARLQQQEALGILGVNLVALAHELPLNIPAIVERLTENLGPERVEINLIRLLGPDVKGVDNRLLNLEMVKVGVTDAILFEPSGEISNPSDELFKRALLVQRGTFRPITNTNLALIERGLVQFNKLLKGGEPPLVLFELTMENLAQEGQIVAGDFLDRVDTLCTLGHKVLLTKFNLFYQVKSFLRGFTDQPLAMIIGASHLEKIMDPQYYKSLPGGILEGFSRLFDDQTEIFVFPYKQREACFTAATFKAPGPRQQLYNFLRESGRIVDIAGCDDVDTSIHSSDVRRMLTANDRTWESLVPGPARDLIIKRKMFGAKG
jgi:hypothetical protein